VKVRARRRLGVATAVLIPLVLGGGLVSSAALGGTGIRFGQPVFEIHRVDEARFNPSPTSDQPVFVLVMGRDAGAVGQSRGDALHVIGVNPEAGRATILNIPRDTWVPIPGWGVDKINAAHVAGGPALQARTVAQFVGVEIPYVVSTGFEGFQAMVDELGGVEVNVPSAMADAASGAFFRAGPTRMLGGEALAFARNRNLAGGDFTRTNDQGILILAALAKLRGEGVTTAKTIHWLSVLFRHATFDGAGLADVYRLGRLALSIDPANVRNVTMPGAVGSAAGQSVVFKGGGADSLFADFRDDAILQAH
jgi:LCP family protein required for cell wall assembly